MTYDDANRLETATSPRFGTASYSYDVLDNIAQLSIGGANARNHFYCYDAATWRLTNLKTTSCATGATVTGFGYDAQGNVNNKNGTLYQLRLGESVADGDVRRQSHCNVRLRRPWATHLELNAGG